MEDAATAEISRAQLWQWLRHGAKLEDGRSVTQDMVQAMLEAELNRLGRDRFMQAANLLLEVATHDPFIDFLTVPGYRQLD
jgi:malate synthase